MTTRLERLAAAARKAARTRARLAQARSTAKAADISSQSLSSARETMNEQRRAELAGALRPRVRI